MIALAAADFRTPKSVLKRDVRQVMDETLAGVEPFDYKSARLTQLWRLFRSELLVRASTSGTTGEPLEFVRGKDTVVRMFFSMLEAMRGLGWEEGDAVLHAWQAPRPRRDKGVQAVLRALGFPLFTFTQIDEASCRRFFDALDRQAPAVLFGFPSYYLEFARFRKQTNHPLRRPPKFLLCGGEMLLDTHRSLLEEVFCTRVYNSCGGNEFGFLACECRARRGLHVLEHAFVVETDGDGHLLLTTLEQREMPLIRYETGDRVRIGYDRCPCGVDGTKIFEIEGRTEEYLLNGHGLRVFSRYFREILLEVNRRFENAILQAQFHQKAGGALRVTLQMVDGRSHPGVAEALVDRLREDLRLPASARFTERLLPREGKVRFLVREG